MADGVFSVIKQKALELGVGISAGWFTETPKKTNSVKSSYGKKFNISAKKTIPNQA